MRFSCKSCSATFQTASGSAPKAAFACPACGGEMAASADVVELHTDRVPTRRYDLDELRARLEVEREESARARGAPRSAEQIWFAAVQGRQVGPLTAAGLQGLRARGQLQAATLVWREGWPAWVAAEAVSDLRPVLGLPEEKPGRPFPVQPSAPAPPPLDATYPHARAGAGDATDPMAPLPGELGPSGTAAIAEGEQALREGDPLRPEPGDLTTPGRPSAMEPPGAGVAGDAARAPGAEAPQVGAGLPATPDAAPPPAPAVEEAAASPAGDGAEPDAPSPARSEAAAAPLAKAAAPAAQAQAREEAQPAAPGAKPALAHEAPPLPTPAAQQPPQQEATVPDAKLPAFPRSDTVPDAVQPEFFEPQPLDSVRPALARAAPPPPGEPPALPHAAADVASLAAAIASAAPAVAADAHEPGGARPGGGADAALAAPLSFVAAASGSDAAAGPAPDGAIDGDGGREAAGASDGAAAVAYAPPGSRRRGRSRPPRPSTPGRARAFPSPAADAAGQASAAPAEPGAGVAAVPGVKVLDLSGTGPPLDAAATQPAQDQWFASAEGGRDFDPRRLWLAILLAVALLVLALLVKAR